MGRKSREKRQRRQRRQPPPWTPFEPATVAGLHSVEVADETFKVFKNSRYTVLVGRIDCGEHWPKMIHLSIKRNDREVIRDWRELQRIKNEMVGARYEGVELFPAEERLVDGANQFHLWVLEDANLRFPFGYRERLVSESSVGGAKQRAFEPDARPTDLRVVSAEELRRTKQDRPKHDD